MSNIYDVMHKNTLLYLRIEALSIKDRIGTSSKIMTDIEKTAFFFVLTPEEMTITDTLKAAHLFAKYRVPLSVFIVNRVISTELL